MTGGAGARSTLIDRIGVQAFAHCQNDEGRPGRVAGTREFVEPGTPYVIPYRLRGDRLEVIAASRIRPSSCFVRFPEVFDSDATH